MSNHILIYKKKSIMFKKIGVFLIKEELLNKQNIK